MRCCCTIFIAHERLKISHICICIPPTTCNHPYVFIHICANRWEMSNCAFTIKSTHWTVLFSPEKNSHSNINWHATPNHSLKIHTIIGIVNCGQSQYTLSIHETTKTIMTIKRKRQRERWGERERVALFAI